MQRPQQGQALRETPLDPEGNGGAELGGCSHLSPRTKDEPSPERCKQRSGTGNSQQLKGLGFLSSVTEENKLKPQTKTVN